jgi:hypothetical protein
MAQPKPDTRTQRQKFIETAREHSAREDAGVFRTLVRGIATAPAKKAKKAAKRVRKRT